MAIKHLAALSAFIISHASLSASPEGQWLDLQLQQIELQTQYRAAHPKMQAYQRDLARVHEQLGEPDFARYASHASERLLELYLSEIELQSKYREQHPTMQQVQQQIAFLETIPGTKLSPEAMEMALEELNREKSAMSSRYREQHPAMQAQRAKIQFLEAQLAEQVSQR